MAIITVPGHLRRQFAFASFAPRTDAAAYTTSAIQMSAKPTSRIGEADSLNINTLRNNMIVGPMYCTNPSVDNDIRVAARAASGVTTATK